MEGDLAHRFSRLIVPDAVNQIFTWLQFALCFLGRFFKGFNLTGCHQPWVIGDDVFGTHVFLNPFGGRVRDGIFSRKGRGINLLVELNRIATVREDRSFIECGNTKAC